MTPRFSRPRFSRIAATAAFAGALGAATLMLGPGAQAHHGWEWADEQQTNLEGVIREIYIGPPHPTLKVETASDGVWDIDLGNPRQTTNAGFVEGSARPGNKIQILGNRSSKKDHKLMKAVRIVVEGKEFLLYPERIKK